MTTDADYFSALTGWMLVVGGLAWCLTMALGVYAARSTPAKESSGRRLIIVCGLALPILAVSLLLVFGLRPLSGRPASPDLVVDVTGRMWWWSVRYGDESGRTFRTANELRLPAGKLVELRLESTDVIHSLWIPKLAAKLDMIPGTTNSLYLKAEATGIFPGACAEYCGTAHAQMLFDVVVLEPSDFDDWLAGLSEPAAAPASATAREGAAVFRDNGCGACHTIRGTSADGKVGPDLTHVGSRHRIGAGVLAAGKEDFAAWIAATESLKPGVHMPSYPMLERGELVALATFLAGLR